MKSEHQQRIQLLTDEITQHEKQRGELESIERELQEELAAFKISSTKEIQDTNATMDEKEIEIYKELEDSHTEALRTIKSDHQNAIDTLLAEHQSNIQHAETQEDQETTRQSPLGIEVRIKKTKK